MTFFTQHHLAVAIYFSSAPDGGGATCRVCRATRERTTLGADKSQSIFFLSRLYWGRQRSRERKKRRKHPIESRQTNYCFSNILTNYENSLVCNSKEREIAQPEPESGRANRSLLEPRNVEKVCSDACNAFRRARFASCTGYEGWLN